MTLRGSVRVAMVIAFSEADQVRTSRWSHWFSMAAAQVHHGGGFFILVTHERGERERGLLCNV